MTDFFYVVKIVAIVQLILVALLICLSFAIKAYLYFKPALYRRINKNLERNIKKYIANPSRLNRKVIKYGQRRIKLLIPLFKTFDDANTIEKWKENRHIIIEKIVLPKAAALSQSRFWENRYIACEALQLSSEQLDEKTVDSLIKDSAPLVSMSAAKLALKYNSQHLMDTIIDTFSTSRHVQQPLYIQIISNADETIIPFIKHRLHREKNPYIKGFCYRTLASLPYTTETVETYKRDFNSKNINLKMSVLDYLYHNKSMQYNDFFLELLHDTHWEVRARAAKLLGEIGDGAFAKALENGLKDRVWWVRINAAEALLKLGAPGLVVLKNQKPDVDQFAYDVAEQVLSTIST